MLAESTWAIRREGRRWRPGVGRARDDGMLGQFAVLDGQLVWTVEEQRHLLGGLLEAVGVARRPAGPPPGVAGGHRGARRAT